MLEEAVWLFPSSVLAFLEETEMRLLVVKFMGKSPTSSIEEDKIKRSESILFQDQITY